MSEVDIASTREALELPTFKRLPKAFELPEDDESLSSGLEEQLQAMVNEKLMECSNLWAVRRPAEDPQKDKLFQRIDKFIEHRYSHRRKPPRLPAHQQQRGGHNVEDGAFAESVAESESTTTKTHPNKGRSSKKKSLIDMGELFGKTNPFNEQKPYQAMIQEEKKLKEEKHADDSMAIGKGQGGVNRDGNPNEFRSFTSIMQDVHKSYSRKRYTDVITQMKVRDRKQVKRQGPLKPINTMNSDSSDSSEDEEMEAQVYVESILFQKLAKGDGGDATIEDGVKYTNEYWDAVKCFHYLEIANPNCSLILLLHLREHLNFNQNVNTMRAVLDCNALSLFFNILDTDDIRCQVAVLKLLKNFVDVQTYCRKITFIGGVQMLVEMLNRSSPDLRFLAAKLLSRVSHFKLARENVAKSNGIQLLVQQLDFPLDRLAIRSTRHFSRKSSSISHDLTKPNYEGLTPEARCVQSAAEALWSMSRSVRHRIIMRQAGMIPLLARLMKANNQRIMVPIIGVLQQCAAEVTYRVSIRTEGMIPYLIENMCALNPWLNTQCALTLFKCAEDDLTREHIRLYGGLDVLHDMLDSQDMDTLIAVTGAIWKCCISSANAIYMQKTLPHKTSNMHRRSIGQTQPTTTTQRLINVLKELPESVEKYVRPVIPVSDTLKKLATYEKIMEHATGALSEFAKLPEGRHDIRTSGGIHLMIRYLDYGAENSGMLVNVCRTLAEIAVDKESLKIILEHMGMRKLVSLLKSNDPRVLSSAAWSLAPCIHNTPNSGLLLRHFVGFLELIANLLDKATDKDVLISVCAVIAEVAKDDENLAVLTDHGIVQKLSRLVYMEGEQFRIFLSEAIACCARHKTNAICFGRAGVVLHLVNYLKSHSPLLHRATVRALHSLSCYGPNCYEMKQAGMAKLLAQMVGSDDRILQEAAAKTIVNMRRKVG